MFTRDRESGQAAIPLILFFAIGVMASAGLAVDVANLWFHRQALQSAADAACQAGALDMLQYAGGVTPPGFTPGTNGTCTTTSTASICQYANYNGYSSAGPASSSVANTSAWNQVTYTFPSSVTGVTAPPSAMSTTNYLQVSITASVRTYLIELVNGFHYSRVTAKCTCGLASVKEAAPMIVLDPRPDAFTYSGGATLNIVGGPQRSLQVNSTSTAAVQCSGSGVINTSKGGPNGTGSDIGIVGNEPEGSNGCVNNGGYVGFESGTTGKWKANVLPISDPFAAVKVPASVKSLTPVTYSGGQYYQWVGYKIDGCPDQTGSAYAGQGVATNCAEFGPGYYPNGIPFPNGYSTVIFLPGVYYLNGSLSPSGSNTMRMAMPCWSSYSGGYSASACSPVSKANNLLYAQGKGAMFYFLSGTFNVSGGASGDTIDALPSQALTCDGSAPIASLNMPATLTNNVLWGQCTTNGTYYDAGGDTTDTAGNPGVRGLLFFEDHANTSSPTFGGSGQLSFSGSLYFHSTSFADVLTLSGGTSSGSFLIGDIVTDQVSLSGSAAINLALPPTATQPALKVGTFQ